jgi:hypothetical protein
MSPAITPNAVSAVWALKGGTAITVECWIVMTDVPLCSLTVTYGGEILLHECYADVTIASLRADAVKEGLLAKGWTPP